MKRFEACEFDIFIKPLCTTSLEDTIRLVTVNMKKGVETFHEVQISFTTQLSTKLDPNELIEEEVLGEGSFGTVYRGTFRGQKVAIKKMKNLENEGDRQKLIEEFDKEVGMLDKFRSIYVINFVGVVYPVNKIAIVTELAERGSIKNSIERRKQSTFHSFSLSKPQQKLFDFFLFHSFILCFLSQKLILLEVSGKFCNIRK